MHITVLLLSIASICVYIFILQQSVGLNTLGTTSEGGRARRMENDAKLAHFMFMKEVGILGEFKLVNSDYKSDHFDFLTGNSDSKAAFAMRK